MIDSDAIRSLRSAIAGSYTREVMETKAVGTVTASGSDGTFVKLEGSEDVTPAATKTAGVKPGDTVSVTIADGQARIDGNLSDPAASESDVEAVRSQVRIIDSIVRIVKSTVEIIDSRLRIRNNVLEFLDNVGEAVAAFGAYEARVGDASKEHTRFTRDGIEVVYQGISDEDSYETRTFEVGEDEDFFPERYVLSDDDKFRYSKGVTVTSNVIAKVVSVPSGFNPRDTFNGTLLIEVFDESSNRWKMAASKMVDMADFVSSSNEFRAEVSYVTKSACKLRTTIQGSKEPAAVFNLTLSQSYKEYGDAYLTGMLLEQGDLSIRGSLSVGGGLSANGEPVSDYPIESGSKNGWFYRKWHSGRLEATYQGAPTAAISTQQGGIYISSKLSVNNTRFPVDFTSAPMVTIGVRPYNHTYIAFGTDAGETTANAFGGYYLMRGNSQTTARSYRVCIRCEGYWK